MMMMVGIPACQWLHLLLDLLLDLLLLHVIHGRCLAVVTSPLGRSARVPISVPPRLTAAAGRSAGTAFLGRRRSGDAAVAVPLATRHLQQRWYVAIGVVGPRAQVTVDHLAHGRGTMTAAHDALALIGGLVHALVAIPERKEGIPSYSL